MTIAVGAAAAVLYWFGQGPTLKVDGVATPRPTGFTFERTADDALAMRYVKAYQAGDCDQIIGLTWWMNRRLQKAALEKPGDADEIDAIRQELQARVVDRPVEGNRLGPEGVEDAYVFAPGTLVRFVSSDKGHDGLSQPVRERVWVRVTYPAQDAALHDESGKPIRSITVGINVSSDGYVVKAGLVGNLDIDRNSITYDWNDNQGG